VKSVGLSPEIFLSAADQIDSPVVDAVLEDYLNAASPGIQAIGLAGSLARSKPGSITAMLQRWPTIVNDPNRQFVVNALRTSWRDSTPGSVRQLVAATPGLSPGLREAAIKALSSIHSKETLGLLASLLSSSDKTEQIAGAQGLWFFANGCPVQSTNNTASLGYFRCEGRSLYRTKETFQNSSNISFWKTWWDAHPEIH